MKVEYSFGYCRRCNKLTGLKDGYCPDCQDNSDMPEFFKDIFRKESKNDD